MFKKTLVAAALATATMGASAYQIGENNDFNVEVYGVAAISAVDYNVGGNDNGSEGKQGTVVENESRIGFRAGKEMIDGLTAFMQIESGYVGMTDWGHGGTHGGVLGFRDTFVGLKGDSWGQVRMGRVLTPLYEIVDWPFSNPGLGSVFDWGGMNAHYDRQANQLRFDSLNYGGFAFAASVGRDSAAASTGNGGNATEGSYFGGANATYAVSIVTLMAGVEAGNDFRGKKDQDNLTYLVGANLALPGGFGLAAAFKQEELSNYSSSDASAVAGGCDIGTGKCTTKADKKTDAYGRQGEKVTQGSYSVIAQYWTGNLGIKVGYAANLESESNGVSQDHSDSNTISGQVMGTVNGFVPYLRVAGRTKGDKDTDIVTRVGLEYGF